MHPIEGIIMIVAGTFGWLIGSGRFPADAKKRQELGVRLPWVQNKALMYGIAALLWAFGLSVMFGFIQ